MEHQEDRKTEDRKIGLICPLCVSITVQFNSCAVYSASCSRSSLICNGQREENPLTPEDFHI